MRRTTFHLPAAALALSSLLSLGGCGGDGETIVLYSSVDQDQFQPIVADFQRKTGVKISAVPLANDFGQDTLYGETLTYAVFDSLIQMGNRDAATSPFAQLRILGARRGASRRGRAANCCTGRSAGCCSRSSNTG